MGDQEEKIEDQKIGNIQNNSNYTLTCIGCGSRRNLVMTAHRNEEKSITGFLISCEDCQPKLPSMVILKD